MCAASPSGRATVSASSVVPSEQRGHGRLDAPPPAHAAPQAPGSDLISTLISRASAVLLLLGGLALLFAPDVILPHLIPGFPAAGAWVGQLVAAAWLAVAALDWLSQRALLGGIYGRPVVLANTVLYFSSATVLVKLVMRRDTPAALWIVVVPAVLFAGVYAWLLLRGPLERDIARQTGAQQRRL